MSSYYLAGTMLARPHHDIERYYQITSKACVQVQHISQRLANSAKTTHLSAFNEGEASGLARDAGHRAAHFSKAVLGVMPDQAAYEGGLADARGPMHQHHKRWRLIMHRLHRGDCRCTQAPVRRPCLW